MLQNLVNLGTSTFNHLDHVLASDMAKEQVHKVARASSSLSGAVLTQSFRWQ